MADERHEYLRGMSSGACRKYADHRGHYGEGNILGQVLKLQCAIEETDFNNEDDMKRLFSKAEEAGIELQELGKEAKRRNYPDLVRV